MSSYCREISIGNHLAFLATLMNLWIRCDICSWIKIIFYFLLFLGLHTCGDLGPTIVRLFAESSKVTSLQSVPCCYMHIKKSFPLSHHLKAK